MVSYCPLCDTIVAFDRDKTTFGVSGKLYQSCLVMYDRFVTLSKIKYQTRQ